MDRLFVVDCNLDERGCDVRDRRLVGLQKVFILLCIERSIRIDPHDGRKVICACWRIERSDQDRTVRRLPSRQQCLVCRGRQIECLAVVLEEHDHCSRLIVHLLPFLSANRVIVVGAQSITIRLSRDIVFQSMT